MNTMAVEFLNNNGKQMTATEEQKQQFIASLKDIHEHGYYVAVNGKGEWKISNKNPEKLESQKEMFSILIDSIFQVVPATQ